MYKQLTLSLIITCGCLACDGTQAGDAFTPKSAAPHFDPPGPNHAEANRISLLAALRQATQDQEIGDQLQDVLDQHARDMQDAGSYTVVEEPTVMWMGDDQ